MPDILEAKCFEFTVQILPPPPLELFLYTPMYGESNPLGTIFRFKGFKEFYKNFFLICDTFFL